MASSNAGLSQRIVDSGRTLVQTAFSNLASDSAIHPPFGSKHAPSGFANSLRAIIPTDFSRNASAEGFSGESFRSASGSVRRVENEYEDFVSGFASSTSSSMTGAEIIHGWLEIGEDCQVHTGWETLPAREQPIIYTHQGSLANTASTWERISQGEVVYRPDGRPEWRWRHEWRRIDVEHTQEPRVASELAKFSSHLGIESRAPRCDQSSALAPLMVPTHGYSIGMQGARDDAIGLRTTFSDQRVTRAKKSQSATLLTAIKEVAIIRCFA
ncbi:hypothetical protein SMMN14_01039 [Sphaerulina musiva]